MTSRQLTCLLRILGRRPFLVFGAVTMLVVALLATIQIACRYALKQYADDQITRIPWDISVYQSTDLPVEAEVRGAVAGVSGIANTETICFLRTAVPSAVVPLVDNQPLRSPWLSLLSATDPALLPPEIRPEDGRAVLVLMGPKGQMGDAFLQLQGRRRFELTAETETHEVVGVFELPLERTVRLERRELNQWFMDQTSSPTMVPELGVILVVKHDPRLLLAYDAISRGIREHVHVRGPADDDGTHAEVGEYFPDVIHLARLDRAAIVSGWDIDASYARLHAIGEAVRAAAQQVSFRIGLDESSAILFDRMRQTARLLEFVGLLVALPLMCVAWVLLRNISELLLLNERRRFGLLRLRGTPGRVLGRTLMLSIASGGVVGGFGGLILGTVVPIYAYAGTWLGWNTVRAIQKPHLLATFLGIGLALSLIAARRLVKYAAAISPLEASSRVAASESGQAGARFGIAQAAALLLGTGKMVAWAGGWALSDSSSPVWRQTFDRSLDFVAFPLFVYGIVSLVVARGWLERLLLPPTRILAGRLAALSLRHTATHPHRAASLLLIATLMATVSLYPTVVTAVFDDKIVRAGRIQLGSPLHLTLNVPDLVPAATLATGSLDTRVRAVRETLDRLAARLEQRSEVQSVAYLLEALVEGLYMRGYGFDGVPLYLIEPADAFLRDFYYEQALGESAPFSELVAKLGGGDVLRSPALAEYWSRQPDRMPVGQDGAGEMVWAVPAGTVRFLPAMPIGTINERVSFISARVDYLNHLFATRAYMVAAADNPRLAGLDVLIPRVVLTVRPAEHVAAESLKAAVLSTLGVEPLQVRELDDEVRRLGSDMFVLLARENLRIYLIGGLLLALIGILTVVLSNYIEDRRTLGLLRTRGCTPRQLLQFLTAPIVSPSLVGIAFGALVALAVGYGITNLVWKMRELNTIMQFLPTHVTVSMYTGLVGILLIGIVCATALGLSRWVYTRTAVEQTSDY